MQNAQVCDLGVHAKPVARGGGLEPPFSGPKPDVLPLDDPRPLPVRLPAAGCSVGGRAATAGTVGALMGSLIKKRRKRMRKKKHKKMLKRTRFQRRAKGK